MAGVSVGKKGKKSLDVDLNLVPFIDVLATCICFLLMTTIWIHLKGIGVHQSIGSEAPTDKKDTPSITAQFQGDAIAFSLKNVKGAPVRLSGVGFKAVNGEFDWEKVEQYLAAVKAAIPGLEMGMVAPRSTSKYEDIINVMGLLKKQKFGQIGISPY